MFVQLFRSFEYIDIERFFPKQYQKNAKIQVFHGKISKIQNFCEKQSKSRFFKTKDIQKGVFMTKCKCMVCDCNTIHDDHVMKAKSQMLDDEILFDIADFYKALADSTRIKIINALD